MPRLLIVDDEEMIREVIREYALFEGYEIREAQNGQEAIQWCQKEDFDVIVMDIMMPGMDGYSAYEHIKKIQSVPCLILSAKGQEYDKLYGYKLGIDDYVVKPFSPKELMARLDVIVSRNQYRKEAEESKAVNTSSVIRCGGLTIDPERYTASAEDEKIGNMTVREFELLYFLASYPELVFSREQLLNQIWGFDYAGDSRTVDTHIKMLRHNLGKYRDYIVTVRGIGYKFDADE